jgi:hypothetical protein
MVKIQHNGYKHYDIFLSPINKYWNINIWKLLIRLRLLVYWNLMYNLNIKMGYTYIEYKIELGLLIFMIYWNQAHISTVKAKLYTRYIVQS